VVVPVALHLAQDAVVFAAIAAETGADEVVTVAATVIAAEDDNSEQINIAPPAQHCARGVFSCIQ
jgi:hypothetical protein